MSEERRERGPDVAQHGGLEEQDARYAEQIAEHDAWPIGDTTTGSGTLKPTDDVGTGGTADVADAGDFGGTASIRGGQRGVAGALAGEPSGRPTRSGPVDRAAVGRAEDRVETGSGGALNAAAVQAAGGPGTAGAESPPGTADLGAAAGADLGVGLGGTRGDDRQGEPRGQVSGIGATRGSGSGTGHLENSAT